MGLGRSVNSLISYISSLLFSDENDEDDDVNAEFEPVTLNDSASLQDYETKMLELSTQESRAYIDHQIAAVVEHRNRAENIVQLNLVVVGFVITLSSFLVRENLIAPVELINFALPFAVFVSFLSVILSLSIFRSGPLKGGISPDNLDGILQENPTTNKYLVNLLSGHKNWIKHNTTINKNTGQKMRLGYVALFVSLLLYGVMILVAI